jgi:DNA-binding PadR family transcriptional regulator
MTEITRIDLWELFIGTQNIKCGMKFKSGYIEYRVCTPGDAETTGTTLRHSIKESDLDDIKDIFADISWSRQPLSGYLLWILWIRRAIFRIFDLTENDKISFTRTAFALIKGEKISDKTIRNAFDTLEFEGYLEKYDLDSKSGGKYFLTPKGERVAKRMFHKKEDGVWVRAESKAKNKLPKSEKKRKNPKHDEHKQKILK